jgi:hypothetical protein
VVGGTSMARGRRATPGDTEVDWGELEVDIGQNSLSLNTAASLAHTPDALSRLSWRQLVPSLAQAQRDGTNDITAEHARGHAEREWWFADVQFQSNERTQ